MDEKTSQSDKGTQTYELRVHPRIGDCLGRSSARCHTSLLAACCPVYFALPALVTFELRLLCEHVLCMHGATARVAEILGQLREEVKEIAKTDWMYEAAGPTGALRINV
eukprot:1535058-Pleurochrysis_carterae.AAC.4